MCSVEKIRPVGRIVKSGTDHERVFSQLGFRPYNKLPTNLANSSRTGEYWPSVVFVRTPLRSVHTATTSGQYSPVRPSRSVS